MLQLQAHARMIFLNAADSRSLCARLSPAGPLKLLLYCTKSAQVLHASEQPVALMVGMH